jgi:hypothetical protein
VGSNPGGVKLKKNITFSADLAFLGWKFDFTIVKIRPKVLFFYFCVFTTFLQGVRRIYLSTEAPLFKLLR